MTYLTKNKEYYDQGYVAENVEGWVFRPFGRIFEQRLGISGERGEKLLDFGCGSGAACRYLSHKGFNAYGVDMSAPDIERARERNSRIADHFEVIDPLPQRNDVFFGGDFDIIISIQTLYFLSKKDMETRIWSLYDQLKKGGLFYATMMSARTYYYKFGKPAEDGLLNVTFTNGRIEYKDWHLQFFKSQKEVAEVFKMFESLFQGYYAYDWGDGDEEHFTFVGRKN